MAIIDVVKWNAAPGVFAWKFPSQELSTATQLIVAESQEAVLIKEGVAIGPFGAGRHVLSTANYPVLTSFVKLVTGISPFTAEVWFIAKNFKLDIKWGTANAIQIEDPKYHIMLPIRAFGQYGIVVDDSTRFLTKLVGTLPAFVERTLTDFFRGIIVTRVKNRIASYMVEKNVSVLQISAYLNEISNDLQCEITAELETYGIRIVNFNVNNISTDETDPAVKQLRSALAKKAEMDIVGYNYQQMRSFDTLQSAAENSGNGNAMNAAVGLGMGMGMGVPMGNAIGGMMGNIQIGATKPCSKCGKQISGDVAFCPHCGTSCAAPEVPAVQTESCPKCGKQVAAGNKFCPECGSSMVCSCPGCGKCITPGCKFCPECGSKIN